MADDLAAVVLRETDIDHARLDEAMQRQVLSGGGLDTALMEMGLIDESALLPLLEKVHGLPSVGRHDIRQIDPGAVAVFPQRLAEKHGIVPLELSGRRLSVAVARKPDLTLLDEIGFMLSVYVRPFVTTEARLAYGLYRLYALQLPSRVENLLGMLGEDPVAELEDERARAAAAAEDAAGQDGAKHSAVASPAAASSPAAWQVAGTADTKLTSSPDGPSFDLKPARAESSLLGARQEAAEAAPSEQGAPAAVAPVHPPADEDAERPVGPGQTLPDPSMPASAERPPASSPEADAGPAQAPPDAKAASERDAVRARLLAEADADDAAHRERAEARRAERVRWTVDDAIAELAMAGDRDGMVDVILRFARRRLTTAAMLVVHRDQFSGWDIIDPELDRGDVTKVSIPVAGDHVLAKLYEMRSPFLGPLDEGDPLAVALDRQPRAALLVPVMVENKLAAVLYGDCGEKSIPPSSLAELHMVAPRFGKALRNLILRQRQTLSGEEPSAEAAAAEPEIEPAAKPQQALPVIELELDDFDEVLEPSMPGVPVPAGADGPGTDGGEEVNADDLEVEDVTGSDEQESEVDDADIETTEVEPSEAAPPDAEAPAGGEIDDTEDGLEAALETMASASDGSFAESGDDADGASAVASLVGVHVSMDDDDDELPSSTSSAGSVAAVGAPAGPVRPPPGSPPEGEANRPSSAAPREGPGAVASELLDEGGDLQFASAYGERDPDLPPPIPRLKRKARNRGDDRIPGAPPPTEAAARAVRADAHPAIADPAGGTTVPPPAAEDRPRPPSVEQPADEPAGEPALEAAGDGASSAPSTSTLSPPAGVASEPVEPPGPADHQPLEDGEQASAPSSRGEAAADEAAADEAAADEAAADEAAVDEGAAPVAAPSAPTATPSEATPSEANEPPIATLDPALLTPVEPEATGYVVAKSPGADARDTLLLATWRDWVNHETPDIDAQLIDLQSAGEAGRAAVNRVVALGEEAMPALSRYFPGVLEVHPFGHMESRTDVRDFSDALACLVRMGPDLAAPILMAELDHEDRLHRYSAIYALSELKVPAALRGLTQRVFDPEYRIALLVLDVLNAYRTLPQFPKILEQLRRMVKQGNEFERKRAILAVSELKDREALPLLVDILGTRPKDIAEEARRALVNLTKQDFANSGRKWRAWIDDHKTSHRLEWLILGLAHKNEEIRAASQAELNHITGQYFGYRYDAPRAERDQNIQRWRAWWAEDADPARYP